jgi:hypothetical protein
MSIQMLIYFLVDAEIFAVFWLVCGNLGLYCARIRITRRLYDQYAAAELPGNGFAGLDFGVGCDGAAE